MVIKTDRRTYIEYCHRLETFHRMKPALNEKERQDAWSELYKDLPLASMIKFWCVKEGQEFGEAFNEAIKVNQWHHGQGKFLTIMGEEYHFWFDSPIMLIRCLNYYADNIIKTVGEDVDKALTLLTLFHVKGEDMAETFLKYDMIKRHPPFISKEWLDSDIFFMVNGYPKNYKELNACARKHGNRESYPNVKPAVPYDEWMAKEKAQMSSLPHWMDKETDGFQPLDNADIAALSQRTNVRIEKTRYEEWTDKLREKKKALEDPLFVRYLEWTDYEPCLWLPLLKDID